MAYPEDFLGQFSARGMHFEDVESEDSELAVVAIITDINEKLRE